MCAILCLHITGSHISMCAYGSSTGYIYFVAPCGIMQIVHIEDKRNPPKKSRNKHMFHSFTSHVSLALMIIMFLWFLPFTDDSGIIKDSGFFFPATREYVEPLANIRQAYSTRSVFGKL